MTVTAPETALRSRLLSILKVEFTAEGVDWRNDKIHDSLGWEGPPVGGVYPNVGGEQFNQGLVQDTTVTIQLFNTWKREVNPNETVAPDKIEEWAERIRRAVRADGDGAPGTDHLWYYRVLRIEFPDDPTGNKTRLLATVQGSSTNSGLVESSG